MEERSDHDIVGQPTETSRQLVDQVLPPILTDRRHATASSFIRSVSFPAIGGSARRSPSLVMTPRGYVGVTGV